MRHRAVRPAIGTGLVLLVPLVMTIVDRHKAAGDGWRWSPMDFVLIGALLFAAGLGYEYFAARLSSRSDRVMLGIATLCVVLAIWVELAAGGISQLVGFLLGAGSS